MTMPVAPVFDRSSTPPDSGAFRREVTVVLHAGVPAVHALAYARAVAGGMRAPLHALVVWPTHVSPRDVPRLLGLAPEALDGVVIDVEAGDPAERTLAYAAARPQGVMVVASNGDGVEPFGLSSPATRLLSESAAAVFVVREPGAERIARILVPLDGTPSTAAALAPAGELARQAGATLEILLVGEAELLAKEPGAMMTPQYVDQPHHEWDAFTAEFLDRFLGNIAHVPHEVTSRLYLGGGDPAAQIVRFTNELRPDLLALVWHGETAHHHGSVFTSVLKGVRCPVLVLRR